MKKILYLCSALVLSLSMSLLCGCDIVKKNLYTENYGALTWTVTKADEGTRIYSNGELLESFPQDENAYILRLGKGAYNIEIKGYKGDKESKTASFQYVVPSLTETKYTSAEEFEADFDDGGGPGGARGRMTGIGGIFDGLNSAKDGKQGAAGKGINGITVIISGKTEE